MTDTFRFTCDICDFKTNVKYSLTSHLKLHSEPCYKCQFCDKKYRQHQGLTHHLKRIHKIKSLRPRGRPKSATTQAKIDAGGPLMSELFKCTSCDYICSSKESLHNHQYLHDQVRNYECEKCGEKFKQSQSLNYHKANICIRTCGLCGLRLKTVERLDVHERMGCIVIDETELEAGQCVICGMKFKGR